MPFYVPLGRGNWESLTYIWKWRNATNWTEWMKGICHIWSRGRHFSPSLPGDRHLNLGSKSDLQAEISGSIVWYDALAPRPEVLFSFSTFYANDVWYVSFIFPRSTPQDFKTIFTQNFNCHFCQFSKSSHFSNVSCIFQRFFLQNNCKALPEPFLAILMFDPTKTYLRVSAITSHLF